MSYCQESNFPKNTINSRKNKFSPRDGRSSFCTKRNIIGKSIFKLNNFYFFRLPVLSLIFFLSLDCLKPGCLAQNAEDIMVLPSQDNAGELAQRVEEDALLQLEKSDLESASDKQLLNCLQGNTQATDAILAHKKTFGHWIDWAELQVVEGLDKETIIRLQQCFYLKNKDLKDNGGPLLKQWLEQGRHLFVIRTDLQLERKKGYEVQKDGSIPFLGDPLGLNFRFRTQFSKKIDVGFKVKKNSGSPLYYSSNNQTHLGLWTSGFISWTGSRWLKKVIVGDFRHQIGQGLVYGAGFSMGKGAESVLQSRRPSQFVHGYNSTTEIGYLRGFYTLMQWRSFKTSTWFSAVNVPTVSFSDSNEAPLLKYNYQGSLRRTANDFISKPSPMIEIGCMGIYAWNEEQSKVGLSFRSSMSQNDYQKSSEPYKKFQIQDANNQTVSLFYDHVWKSWHFFGEHAQQSNGQWASLHGIAGMLSKNTETSIVWRKYTSGYNSLYSQSLSEFSDQSNEQGCYWGWRHQPSKKWILSGYVDVYETLWLRYRTVSPYQGKDALIKIAYQPAKKIDLIAQYRFDQKERSATQEDERAYSQETFERSQFQCSIDYRVHLKFRLKTKWVNSMSQVGEQTPATGTAVFQDFEMKVGKNKLSLRMGMFDVDAYDCRIYQYEQDVPYTFSFPAYSGQGTHHYVLWKQHVLDKLDVWFKVSRLDRYDVDRLGTGFDGIDVAHQTEFRVQCQYVL